jgi:NAD(P)-dependent dehydrogenase (short-subunit alcohol dehydrogenase family)
MTTHKGVSERINTQDLNSERCIVFIGGSEGLGFEAIKQLISNPEDSHPYRIIIGSRKPPPPDKLFELKEKRSSLKTAIEHRRCDLANYESLRVFTSSIQADIKGALYRLVLCAGIVSEQRVETVDGEERTLQVNALSNALTIQLLRSKLVASPGYETPRIVFIGSILHKRTKEPGFSPNDVDRVFGDTGLKWNGMKAYPVSKLVQLHIFFIASDDRAESEEALNCVAVCPGFVPTTGLSRESPWYKRFLMKYVLRWAPFATSLKKGGSFIVNAISNEALRPGTYLEKLVETRAAQDCYDLNLRVSWKAWLEEKGLWSLEG